MGAVHCISFFLHGYHRALILFQNANVDINSVIADQEKQVQRTILLALIPVVVAFSFIVFVFYRSRREAFFKQREADFKLSIAQGELKALRAQMSPHFIFNCMNSIHHYMHTNQAHAAEYLIKFSQLIRHVLETSSLRMVTLADEIEANRNYIQLEQLRLNHSFEFKIKIDPALDGNRIQIPPMIIQPFIENSIWHGLNQLGEGGEMKIQFAPFDEFHVQCEIEDNGKPSHEKSKLDLTRVVKKTSMGMALIEERLQIINSLYSSKARFEIKTLEQGKKITLILPFED